MLRIDEDSDYSRFKEANEIVMINLPVQQNDEEFKDASNINLVNCTE